VRTLLDHIPKQKHGLRVKHVNLFDFVLNYLKSRKLLDKAIQMQSEKGGRDAEERPRWTAPRVRSSALCSQRLPDRISTISSSCRVSGLSGRYFGPTRCLTTFSR